MAMLHFDCRDIFKSARLALSPQRLWIQFVGLFYGYLGYLILSYLSLWAGGQDVAVYWSRFGLLPCVLGMPLPWYSWIIFGLGAAMFIFAWLVSATAVARAAYMHLKGNAFYTWKQALRFSLKDKGVAVVSVPLAIGIILLFTCLGGGLIGLLGRINVIGELGIALFSVVWFLASLFLIVVIAALVVSLLLTPAILATTDDDAFEGIFQSFTLVFAQPWRIIFYEILLAVVAIFGLGVFAFIAKHAWNLLTTIFIWGMGDKYADLSYSASYLLQNWIYPAVAWSRALLGDYSANFFFARDFTSLNLPIMMTISSYIFAIFLVIITGLIACFPLAIFNVGQAVIYMIIKQKKDDENLLERKDREADSDTDGDAVQEIAVPNTGLQSAQSEEASESKA